MCITKWFYLTRCKLYKCNTTFSGFTLKKGGRENPARAKQSRQKFWGVLSNLRFRKLNMWNGKLSSLCCLLVRKQNSPLVLLKLAASLKHAIAEIPSRSYSFHIFSLFLLPNLFPREIIAPCIFQGFEVSSLQTTSNHRQKFHPLAMLVTAYCCLCQSPFPA